MSRIETEGPLAREKQIHLLIPGKGALCFYGANAPHLGEWILCVSILPDGPAYQKKANQSRVCPTSHPPFLFPIKKISQFPSKIFQFPFIIPSNPAYDINSKVMKT
ncbi:hypothetical protein [Lacrimispora saccharolytica]|uniref:hypothetical protein n=1 Tax=Lacrimispora saccharolytica TaxID=84030 RepID=UPI00195DB1C0|nr:hypothetical protein [Lacrimispora saccharolytica]QRV18857.1 hypothetical protein I6K70_15335 [Lacrimispora saccharolytica]